ncbi:hypothetical protein RD792_000052 [Penstemon davidsonii]|uniref:ZF-HD dimerization-type domain-containing protein n=1 Tax=Penstemon davidsonii TaxID=160366 RepID=A0ABR0DV77_9LAMI|nr:hypothetical protein RD792_000052 [Penstemon davidsonii]
MAANFGIHRSKVEFFVTYKECLHKPAAKAMRHVFDGCGQFLASGPDGTQDALLCVVCHCHRNFHRRVEMELPRTYNPESYLLKDTEFTPSPLSHQQPPPQLQHDQNPTMHLTTPSEKMND